MAEAPESAAKALEQAGLTQPQAIVTLKVADERDRTIWVAETPDDIYRAIGYASAGKGYGDGVRNLAEPGNPLLTLTRIQGMKGADFRTRFDNIASVGAYL